VEAELNIEQGQEQRHEDGNTGRELQTGE
jgi:hypothetical protein